MIMSGIKDLTKTFKLKNVTINLEFIRLNFAGIFPKRTFFNHKL